MDIVKHNELRSLMKKGLGYHDQQPPNVSQALKSFESGIDSFIYKVSNKTATPIKGFSPWRYDILSHASNNTHLTVFLVNLRLRLNLKSYIMTSL